MQKRCFLSYEKPVTICRWIFLDISVTFTASLASTRRRACAAIRGTPGALFFPCVAAEKNSLRPVRTRPCHFLRSTHAVDSRPLLWRQGCDRHSQLNLGDSDKIANSVLSEIPAFFAITERAFWAIEAQRFSCDFLTLDFGLQTQENLGKTRWECRSHPNHFPFSSVPPVAGKSNSCSLLTRD